MRVKYRETKDFFKMRFKINEDDFDTDESEVVSEIQKLILALQKDSFGNADKRKEFVKLISQIALSNDPEARRVIKALGNFMSSYKISGIEMEVDSDGNAELEIKAKQNEVSNNNMKKKIQFKSKHMKEMYGDMMDEMGYDVVSDDVMNDEFIEDDFDSIEDEELYLDDEIDDDSIDLELEMMDDSEDELSDELIFNSDEDDILV